VLKGGKKRRNKERPRGQITKGKTPKMGEPVKNPPQFQHVKPFPRSDNPKGHQIKGPTNLIRGKLKKANQGTKGPRHKCRVQNNQRVLKHSKKKLTYERCYTRRIIQMGIPEQKL